MGAQRDMAGHRQLHMNQYGMLILIGLFRPLVDSLRGLQQASELNKVRKQFGAGHASLGSLSESVTIFDPEPLKPITAELSSQIPGPKSRGGTADRGRGWLGDRHGDPGHPAGLASQGPGQIALGLSTAYAF